MAASASRSSSSQAALPPWVKELLAFVPETRSCVVSMSRGEFVVKVRPVETEKWLKPQPQDADHLPQRVPRGEVQLPGTRVKTARQLRSDDRARRHAAKRHSSLLRLQGLIHRHLWRTRGRQRMQDVWTEWSRSAAPPLPTPVPPRPRPLLIVDPAAFPVLSSAPAAASAGLRKREVAVSPTPASPMTTLVSISQPPSAWATVKKPRKLMGFYHDAAAAPPAAARPPLAPPDDKKRDFEGQRVLHQ